MSSELKYISQLAKTIAPVHPDTSVDAVSQLFLDNRYKEVLSIPVVDRGIVVGVVSRYDFMKVYLHRFGRDLYARKSIHELMNTSPIKVDASLLLEDASDIVTERITFPIKEDFIVTDKRKYLGMGFVLDLLKAMEDKVKQRQEELNQAYQQLKESQAQLVQSSKMAALGTMVAGVAHEINTPLGYVKNNVQMTQSAFAMAEELKNNSEQFIRSLNSDDEEAIDEQLGLMQELIEEINEDDFFDDVNQLQKDTVYGLEQIAEIVMGLKNFSRMDQALEDEVNLNECLDAALVIGRNVIKGKAEVIKDYGDIPAVSCAPSKVNQVFLNIMTNAAQAIDGYGEIRITTNSADGQVYVSIKDNGKGIPDDLKAKIFDPFFTTKAVGEGTGLGLSICHQIIEQHNGSIELNSTEGEGTEFIITLPTTESSTAAAPEVFIDEREAQSRLAG